MNDPLALLKQDHRAVKDMLSRLADQPPGKRARLVAELEAALDRHMQLEEEEIYPLLVEHLGEEKGEEATSEHSLTREGLQKLAAYTDQPGFGAVVDSFKGGLLHHVSEEEREILPELKRAIGREEWRNLGDVIAQAMSQAKKKRARAATS